MTSVSDLNNFFRYVAAVQGTKTLFYRFIRPLNVPKGEEVYDTPLIQFYEHDIIHALERDKKKYFEGNHRILLYPHKLAYSFKNSTINKLPLFNHERLSVQEFNFVIFDVDVNSAHKNALGVSHTHAKDVAYEVVHKIKDYLSSVGYRKLLVVDSGNGFHLMCPIRVKLPGEYPKYNQVVSNYKSRCKQLTDTVRDVVGIQNYSDFVNIDPVYNSNIKQLIKSAGSVNRKHWEDYTPRLSKIIYPLTNGTACDEALSQNTELFQKIPIPRYLEPFTSEKSGQKVYRDFIDNDTLRSKVKNPEISNLLGVYNSIYYAAKIFKLNNYSRNQIEEKMVCSLLKQGYISFVDIDKIMCLLLAEVTDAKWFQRDEAYRLSIYGTAVSMNSKS